MNKRRWALELYENKILLLNWVFLIALLFSYSAVFAAKNTDERGARYWVDRMSAAGNQSSYAGTMVIVSAQRIVTLRNIHASIDNIPYGVMIKLDGSEKKAYRAGDVIYTIEEKTKEIISDHASLTRIFPSLLRFDPQALEGSYEVYSIGQGRVAGRMADIVKFEARDQLRFSFQIWLDQESGLPLRGQAFNLDGQVIEQITFSEIQFGLDEQDLQMLKTYVETLLTQGYKIAEVGFDKINSDADLIVLREHIPGFKLVRAVSRAEPTTQRKIGQWFFSDGLVSISIFAEPVANTNGNQGEPMQYVSGITHGLSIYKSGHKVTLVGEVPQETLIRLANSLEFTPKK